MPFIETALIDDDDIQAILHCGGIRLNVTGAGDLLPKLESLSSVRSQDLFPIVLDEVTDKLPNVLSNFSSQKMKLRLETNRINEYVNCNEIILFMKPMYTGNYAR